MTTKDVGALTTSGSRNVTAMMAVESIAAPEFRAGAKLHFCAAASTDAVSGRSSSTVSTDATRPDASTDSRKITLPPAEFAPAGYCGDAVSVARAARASSFRGPGVFAADDDSSALAS